MPDVTVRSCLYQWRSFSAVLNNLAGPDTKWEDICCFLCLSPFMVEPVCNGAAVWGMDQLYTPSHLLTNSSQSSLPNFMQTLLSVCLEPSVWEIKEINNTYFPDAWFAILHVVLILVAVTGIMRIVAHHTLLNIWEQGQISWCSDYTTEWATEESFDSWQGQGIFLFSQASIPTLGPTQRHMYWFAGPTFPPVKKFSAFCGTRN